MLIFLAAVTGLTSFAKAAEGQKVLILPLKIATLQNTAQLTAEADGLMEQAALEYNFDFLARTQAENALNYQADWPPTLPTLKSVAQLAAYDILVVGTLTEIGGQVSLDLKLFDLLAAEDTQFYTTQSGTLAEISTVLSQGLGAIASYTSRESVIASIAPAGNNKIDSGAILQNIRTQPGDIYSPTQLREDLRSIYAMGYFDDIQIEVRQESDGKVVIFQVTEKPVIKSIVFSGTDEIKEENVKEVVTTKEQSILNPMQISKDKEALLQLYKTKGYYNTEVSPEITYPTDDSAVVEFVIEEGPKIYIKEISFEGNSTFDDDDLEDVIETDTKGWFSWFTDSGLLDYDKLNQDIGRIYNFYGNNGFLETKIGDPVVRQEEEWLYITFIIEEGPRFRVGEVNIQGDLLLEKEALLEKLELPKMEYVSREVLRNDVLAITDIYAEQGYANADIRPRIDKSTEEDTIDVMISIEQGELVYINRITITGNDRTRDNVIRRELKVEEGGIFNSKAMRNSIQKLQFLEFFEEVSITPEQSFDTSTVDLSVEVKEKSTGRFTIGAGFSSVENFIFTGEIAENNFLGRGDTLAFSTNIGGESTRYNLRYFNPRLNDSRLSWGVDLFDTEREFDDYTKDSIGGAISVGYPVWEKWRGFAKYSFTDTELSEVDEDASFIIRESQDIEITSAVKLTMQRDTRNRKFGPSKGSKHSFSVEYAGGPLGGDSQYTKIEGFTSWYFAMFWDTVFHFHGAAGQAFENEDGGLPVYERFYLGGLRSIRGFESSKVSPIDPETGERIGGDKMWYTNFEIIFPLLADQGVNGVIFYDMGNVFDDDEDWGVDDFEMAVGAGVRWFSPMGPLRLEWGYNLDAEDDEDESVWDFSIGGVF
ncbi:MAG: outer membrane protein assembly factor BamA [Desulfocapsaceae bacterium]|nr:outer membrane protein assembly factor BamA [Desulfocapsaceae bacterium]